MSIRLVSVWDACWLPEQPVEADLVVGVPNSSLSAAMGFGRVAAGLPNEMGLVKNQYIAARLSNQPSERRERAVRIELKCHASVGAGKRGRCER